MNEFEKNVKFVSKLVELSQKGELEWKPSDAPDEFSSTSFITEVGGQPIRVYTFARQVPASPSSIFSSFSLDNENSRTITIYGDVIDIMDARHRVLYSFRDVTGTHDLFESASRSAANVDRLIEAVLSA
ncbi:hypothetical protein JNB91_01330 [Rhizobium wenxiniae]|uniref:hypothetical protein n=1 Tax=Rhizobium wenxiniae TaxID=1737357 RepID=UPI001C6F3002|nr:hypothetical protein [Rhizobium wenxiniae]MBW9086472.1 hypothetical protein [Rhizobium wenxiniae]